MVLTFHGKFIKLTCANEASVFVFCKSDPKTSNRSQPKFLNPRVVCSSFGNEFAAKMPLSLWTSYLLIFICAAASLQVGMKHFGLLIDIVKNMSMNRSTDGIIIRQNPIGGQLVLGLFGRDILQIGKWAHESSLNLETVPTLHQVN